MPGSPCPALASTAYSPNGTPSAGTSSTSAASASATPATGRSAGSGRAGRRGRGSTGPDPGPRGRVHPLGAAASARTGPPARRSAARRPGPPSSSSSPGRAVPRWPPRPTQVRNGGNGPAGFLGDDRRLPVTGARPAVLLGDEQPGAAQVGGQRRATAARSLGLLGLGPGEHRRPRAAVGEQVADHGPQLLLGVASSAGPAWSPAAGRARAHGWAWRHRGRSFQGTLVSVRGSAGRPSTRSAMMLRRISEVPPSIELPRARR